MLVDLSVVWSWVGPSGLSLINTVASIVVVSVLCLIPFVVGGHK
jgi:hypothetical protein